MRGLGLEDLSSLIISQQKMFPPMQAAGINK